MNLPILLAAAVALMVFSPAEARPCPVYPQDKAQMAVDAVKTQSILIRGVSLIQNGCGIDILIRGGSVSDKEMSRQIGDNAVRLVKALGPDDFPGKEIGRGVYDYRVRVRATKRGKWLVYGTKPAESTSIKW